MSKMTEYDINKKLEDRLEIQLGKICDAVNSALKLEIDRVTKAHEQRYSKEYEMIEHIGQELKNLYDASEILEKDFLDCDDCGKAIEEYHKPANDEGWDICKECWDSMSTCDQCESKGSLGTNSEPNNINWCDDCGHQYCDNCGGSPECNCEDEREAEEQRERDEDEDE